jgi:hypothetical protein
MRIALVVGVGAACAAGVAAVAANHAVAIQVLGAIAGAILTTGGIALIAVSWPHRRASDTRSLLVAFGFFLACIGGFTMAAGAGLYH